MDRHVRWFTREIAVGVAQRLAVETLTASAIVLGALILTGVDPLGAILGAFVTLPVFAIVRFAMACFSNPMTSAYLMRWPHPAGSVLPTAQTNVGSSVDTALKSYQFTPRGAFDEWGGAVTNVYTRDSNQIIVTSSSDDDVVVISGLDDERLVVTTTQLIPPHERLVLNRRTETDVRAVLASHVELVKELTVVGGHTVTHVGIDQIIELLAIEWDAWDQIGPLMGPFVAIGQRRQPTLLQVQVSADEILERTGAPAPRITAQRTAAPQLAPSATGTLAAPTAAPQPAGMTQQPVAPALAQPTVQGAAESQPGAPNVVLPAPSGTPAHPPVQISAPEGEAA